MVLRFSENTMKGALHASPFRSSPISQRVGIRSSKVQLSFAENNLIKYVERGDGRVKCNLHSNALQILLTMDADVKLR